MYRMCFSTFRLSGYVNFPQLSYQSLAAGKAMSRLPSAPEGRSLSLSCATASVMES